MRPTILHVGGVLYWTIQTRNPDTMVLKDADSTPTVAVRKNGASVGDSVTITKRSATTGLYDCSYNPAAEVEGDSFQFEESAAVTGTTTSSATYVNQFSVRVRALERGTDGALQPTVAGRTLNISVDSEGDAVLNSETSDKIDLILEDTGATIPGLIGNITTDWTLEQRTYILEQLALLTVSGASVVVTSGVYMCARGDVEQVYGNTNTATWADLNNNQNSSEITSRINYHIAIADNYIRSVLTQGAWVMPVEGDTIPAILAYNCARLAGVLLYEGRGVTDYDPKGRAIHQLSNHKNGVDSFLKSVVYGSTDLSPLVKSSTNEAPTAS